MTLSQEQLRVLHARDEIRQVLAIYCRAVDRMDRELAASIWHPDARLEYVGVYEGDASGFLDWLWPVHESMEMHSHQVAQSIIEVEGETARSETYVTATLWTSPADDGSQTEVVSRGRYLDHWALHAGRWCIRERLHLADMQTFRPLAAHHRDAGVSRDEQDRSTAWLAGSVGDGKPE